MRRLIWIATVLALIWSAWWFGAAFVIRQGLAQSEDLQARSVAVTGYPVTFETRISDLRVAGQASGTALAVPMLDVITPAWWPGDAAVHLAGERLRINVSGAAYDLTARNAAFHLGLRPGLALELETIGLQSGAWQIDGVAGRLLSGPALSSGLVQKTKRRGQYDWDFDANALRVGEALRDTFGAPADWPATLSAMAAQGSVRFADALNRHHLEGPLPPLEEVHITEAQAIWGDVEIGISGAVQFDATGVPDGEIAVLVQNWRTVYAMARGTAPPQAELMLNALANIGGDPDTLDLVLRFEGGSAFLGPIALGPAPPLRLR